MSDKTEQYYQETIRVLEERLEHYRKVDHVDKEVLAEKNANLEARIKFATETMKVAKAVNEEAVVRIAKLELELSGERQKNRSAGLMMELLVSTNAELRARLSKHEEVEAPQEALKLPDGPTMSSSALGLSSSDYYFDKTEQTEDRITREQEELRSKIVALEMKRCKISRGRAGVPRYTPGE
jgi:hypothetical protein